MANRKFLYGKTYEQDKSDNLAIKKWAKSNSKRIKELATQGPVEIRAAWKPFVSKKTGAPINPGINQLEKLIKTTLYEVNKERSMQNLPMMTVKGFLKKDIYHTSLFVSGDEMFIQNIFEGLREDERQKIFQYFGDIPNIINHKLYTFEKSGKRITKITIMNASGQHVEISIDYRDDGQYNSVGITADLSVNLNG